MTLSSAQQATILADIQAENDMKNIPPGSDGDFAIAALYNALASPTFWVFSSAVPLSVIRGAITWKKLTSNAAMPASPATNTAPLTWINACLACQENLALILGSQINGTLDATPPNVVQGLSDCLSAVPSKPDGTTQDAGWATLQPLLARQATRIEKLLANTATNNGSTNLLPALAPFGDGYQISESDIATIRGS